MTWTLTLDDDSYETARERFAWGLPDDYNLAYDLVGKHDPDRPALYQAYPDGRRETYTFGDLDALSDRLANGLAERGIERGDRVAVVLPQRPANVLTHLACWKLGAISLPLSVLFGTDALRYRLDDSGARVVVTDPDVTETALDVAPDCDALEHVVEATPGDVADAGTPTEGAIAFADFLADEGFETAETDADTPAVILYTSGSTGPPKGVLHGHGVWVGHCPAFAMYFEHDLDGVYWTPADWAWIGALGDLVFPAWHYGQPVVGYPMEGFDAETAFSLLAEFDVTGAFVPPTAIRMLMGIDHPAERYDLSLEAICSGGEPLTPEILDWADETLAGVVVNELYGQTEANLLVTNSQEWFPAQPGSMGKPVPGHDVAIVDPETGQQHPRGETGEIAVRRGDDPVIFQEYWNEPEKTAAAAVENWHLTGDLGTRDEDGYLWFKSRDDDLIITSGYRVGPGEVEAAILDHASVEQVGVIGVPDETRGEIIKAFVQPVAGVSGSDGLREEIQQHVRDRLAKYEYPRAIAFVEDLPQTTTGKIQRRKLREQESRDGDATTKTD
ncbi:MULTISPECIES: acyl-CoA synthetase [Halococcus]|uniref:AMP-dependent synthetase and ligase n=1 Tax=Halococcus salifodinae DSM 8989 TaxID=1227456 RepID=M0N8H2_9EURY|nr:MULTISPECIES: AMP-binding protein [Halococcus]EMA53399.1 AMP-dependent synthetase and ligase [Halococcus salifodinae DSM 8989]